VPSITLSDQQHPIEQGQTLFEVADLLGVHLPSSCRRDGSCHECIVQIDAGMDSLSPRTDEEAFLSDPYRLACEATVISDAQDIAVSVMARRPQILTQTAATDVIFEPRTLRQGDTIVRDGEVIDSYRDGVYGLAVDLGTTTVVAHLVDLESGERVYTTAFENPQTFGGSDVLHRIKYDTDSGHSGELRKVVVGHLNAEIRRMPIKRVQIYEMAVAGNATMRDLFFGLDVTSLGQKPFWSQTETAVRGGDLPTTSLSVAPKETDLLMNRRGVVYGVPLVACHVGADTAAAMLATQMHNSDEITMLVDIGTNTEIVVGNKDRLIAASSPAGPAFEGGGIRAGMPGLEGAIERVWWEGDRAEFSVIGDVAPRGVCGSGLVDAMAELRRHEVIDTMGRFGDGGEEYLLSETPRVALGREDISELSQAKAATYAGQKILLRELGVGFEDVAKVYVAGGFANYLNLENAIAIGLMPSIPVERMIKVGNASLEGVTQIVCSKDRLAQVEELVRGVEHVELEEQSDFFDIYVDGCFLEPMMMM